MIEEELAAVEEELGLARALLDEAADFLDAWWLTQATIDDDGDVEDEGSTDLVRRIRDFLDTVRLPRDESVTGRPIHEDTQGSFTTRWVTIDMTSDAL